MANFLTLISYHGQVTLIWHRLVASFHGNWTVEQYVGW